MSPEARQVLLDMKGRLSAGWNQGRLTPGLDNSEIELVAAAESTCLAGAAIAVRPGDYNTVKASPGTAFSGPRGLAGTSFQTKTGSAAEQALEAIAAELGDVEWPEAIQTWNDEPGRTQQDVIDLIDRVLAKTAPDKQAPDRAREESHA